MAATCFIRVAAFKWAVAKLPQLHMVTIIPMPRLHKQRDLTFYLLKDSVTNFADAFSPADDLQSFDVPPELGFAGKIIIRTHRSSPPWWLSFLRTAVNGIPDLINANTAALILLEAQGRKFAITFGYGRNLLALNRVQRDFGLRVTLNVVDPAKLRSVDARTFEELTVSTRTQTSRVTGLESFGINETQEILKAATGTPVDSTLAKRITGADAAKLTYSPTFESLAQKCCTLLTAYNDTKYKERFAFIDYLREVRDKEQITLLNGELVNKIESGELSNIHLAPPEASDWGDIDDFVFSAAPSCPMEDLDISRYVNLPNSVQLSLERLESEKVGVRYVGSAEPNFKWTVFETIVAELRQGPLLYVLTGGSWYQVESDFAEKIAREIRQRVSDVVLPSATANESEGAYNARVASTNGLHLFDEQIVAPDGARSGIEFCDLLTNSRKLIHVKRRTRSSTLSHLFAQGVISAEAFAADATYRQRLKIKATSISNAAHGLIPTERPITPEWEIIYAIVTQRHQDGPQSLPFFSQLNFKNAADRLSQLGYKVSIALIPVDTAHQTHN